MVLRYPENWTALDEEGKKQEFLRLFEVMTAVKSRCHNVTPAESLQLSYLASIMNTYFPNSVHKVSACEIPNIVAKAAKMLHGMGLRGSPYAYVK